MRLIYSCDDIAAGRQVGPDGLLDGERVRPSAAAADSQVREAIGEIASIYAYPALSGTADGAQGGAWVRANMVASADGAATLHGRSGGLSGSADQLVFSVLRSLADVILVGAGTARAERYGQVLANQAWTQLREGRSTTPPIAVVTRRLDLDLAGPLVAGRPGLAPSIVFTTEAAPADRRAAAARTAEVIIAGTQTISVQAVIRLLASAGYRRILTEGGPTLLGQLVAADLLDELCLTISPLIEGGLAGRVVQPPGHADARDAPGWPGQSASVGVAVAGSAAPAGAVAGTTGPAGAGPAGAGPAGAGPAGITAPASAGPGSGIVPGGPAGLPDLAPTAMRLASVVEDSGHLLLRYLRNLRERPAERSVAERPT